MSSQNYKVMFRFEDVGNGIHIEFLYFTDTKEYAVAVNGQLVYITSEKTSSPHEAQIDAWNFFADKTDMLGRKRIQTAAKGG